MPLEPLSKILQSGNGPLSKNGTSLGLPNSELTPEEYAALRLEWANSRKGALKGDHCPDCNDRGYSFQEKEGAIVTVECHCMALRRSKKHLERSGLTGLMEAYTFASFQTTEPWQATAKQMALDYLQAPNGKWFLVSGSVGAGKTHLCTALCREFLARGTEVRYMLWRTDGTKLKALVNDAGAYERLIGPFRRTPVLYIDDFWKGKVTDGDKNLAFDLLNWRYQERGLATLISSELLVEDILELDEAVGSRIYERSKGSYVRIVNKPNWRLRAEK